MNVELLRQIIDIIDQEPRRLEMDVWAVSKSVREEAEGGGDYYPLFDPPCGTAACIYGWAQLLQVPTELRSSDQTLQEIQTTSFVQQARDLFQLEDLRMTGRLVFVSHWPTKFEVAYGQARTDEDARAAADVAIARIRHFIATEGRE